MLLSSEEDKDDVRSSGVALSLFQEKIFFSLPYSE
jgi:hypothetical protein